MKYKLTSSCLSINGFPIRDFSAEFERVLLIKGRIGCGKTLLLKALAGVYAAEGTLSLTDADGADALGGGYFVHSQPEFNFVTGNIADEAAFAGINPVYFKDYLNKSTKHLSGGELKKLSVLMALKSDFNFLLLDEPLDMLDDVELNAALNFIMEASKEKTAVIATHSECFDGMADDIIYLEKADYRQFIPDKIPSAGEVALKINAPALSLRYGEIGVIFGRNASGKTRILRSLAGLKSWGEETGCKVYSDEVGVCLQFPENMIWQDSIADLIADIAGKEYVTSTLENLGWEKRTKDHPIFLSDGEKRILIITANLQAKKILIFDEPFASLDPETAEQVKTAFYEAALNGKTVLYTANREEDIFLKSTAIESICKVVRI
jgi:energy-coupling factor transporter ATP-binding protein EcfA2